MLHTTFDPQNLYFQHFSGAFSTVIVAYKKRQHANMHIWFCRHRSEGTALFEKERFPKEYNVTSVQQQRGMSSDLKTGKNNALRKSAQSAGDLLFRYICRHS